MMKSTGCVRKIDELGRVVIPMELRRTMGIEEKDGLEIYVDGDRIILKKYEPSCTFCGFTKEDMVHHGGKLVCPDCVREMNKQVVLDKATSKKR